MEPPQVVLQSPSLAGVRQRAAAWWRDRATFVVNGRSLSVPLSGTLNVALHAVLPESEVTAVTLEFGVVSPTRTLRALQADNWLTHFAGPDHAGAAAIKSKLRNAFYPDDNDWKAIVWAQGRCAIEDVMTGFLGAHPPRIWAQGSGRLDAEVFPIPFPGTGTLIAGAINDSDGVGGADCMDSDGLDADGEEVGFFEALGDLLGGLG